MFITNPSLKEFIERVPVCEQTAAFASLLEIFRSGGCDRVVVVSEQQHPLGVVNLRAIMPHLIVKNQFKKQDYLIAGVAIDLQQPLCELDLPLIEKVATLPAWISLSQFWLYLRSSNSQTHLPNWAVVDPSDKFLGLLDSQRLVKFLATIEEIPGEMEQRSRGTQEPRSKGTQENWHAGELESTSPTGCTKESLVQLLEQLPLPLRLQTITGQIIAQNLTWRQQIGESLDPYLEEPEEAPVFIDSLWQEELVGVSSSGTAAEFVNWWEGADQTNNHQMSATEATIASRETTSWEAVTRNPTTKKIGDRLWQFVTIPLRQNSTNVEEKRIRVSEWENLQHYNTTTPLHSLSPDLSLVMATDVTEQHIFAKELAAKNADLVQLNRMKDEFLACISHELKTPLTSVLGLASLLKDQLIGQLNERQARYARLIHQSGRQLMTVVNDILDLTRMETGQLELTPEPVHIPTVCDRAITQARQLQPGKEPLETDLQQEEISFTLSIEPELETMVADELRLRQMLSHLLSNALKFTESGGAIGLKVACWEGWIAFTIWDTGIGIPEAKQHLIFQKFQQLEDTLTRRFDGTGLGLALTQRLAHLHGGDISFISKVGEGSQFTLLLPPVPPPNSKKLGTEQDYSQPPISNKQKSKAQNPKFSNRLILIVEAVPQYIEDLTQQLTGLGYRYAIARSGTEAIEKARQLQPQALLLNPLLPLLSGWDVLTLLKSDEQTRHIPVLVTASQGEKEQASANRADGFLTLPVQTEALRHSLISLKAPETPTPSLTILHLTFEEQAAIEFSPTALGLSPKHRVLEADDIEQAELLVRVWHPNVVILDGAGLEDPLAYLKELSLTDLASLPLITLDRQTTQAANQVTGLSVFPCLASDRHENMDALLQVIQVAAGISCQSNILVVDARSLTDVFSPTEEIGEPRIDAGANTSPYDRTGEAFDPQFVASPQISSSNGSPLLHYLESAGFKSLLSRSWAEVCRQLQHQNVDLLLIDLADIKPYPALVEALTSLKQMPALPPILVLDHRWDGRNLDEATIKFEAALRAIATKILSVPPLSMAEVLDHIHASLAQTSL